MQTWRLGTLEQTIVLCSEQHQLPSIVYWGGLLAEDEDIQQVADSARYDVNGGMLDQVSDLSVAPQHSNSFPGQTAMQLRDAQGNQLWLDLTFVSEQRSDYSLCLNYRDSALGIDYQLQVLTDVQTNMFTFSATVQSEQPIYIDWLAAPVLPAPQNSQHTLEFSGRWCGELQMQIVHWRPGARLRECHLGRSSHEHFPALLMPCSGSSNSNGSAYGLHYGWSGGHKMLAEELPDGRRQIQFGHASQTDRKTSKVFKTAPLYATYSNNGLNGLARAFQSHLRHNIVSFADSNKPRPIHYNCWEAVYFQHDLTTLKDIARRAADLGAERFVLDDGWFKNRNDDCSSLGDWWVDPLKYPQGLTPLIEYIQSLDMGFGLWFEPEMVSPDSDLYRRHPQWILGPQQQLLGRQQLVLDLSQVAVREYLFERMSSLLSEYPIEYIKWDHNRVLPQVDAAQTRGLYQLLIDLREAHPEVEIESCSSGGGRIDFGILQHTQRIWLSDSNDALERFWMQHNAALFFPSEITGSHIGPARCHTSGRELPIAFRAWVAASRHLGFEMDPRELSDSDIELIKEVSHWYKTNRDWLHCGHILRLDSDDSAVLGELQLAADGSQLVAFVAQMSVSQQVLPRPIRLTGLQPTARYQIKLHNPQQSAPTSRGNPALKTAPVTLSGRVLMERGIQLPIAFAATLWVIEGKKL
ncbi:alpha-galactosidase ['Osedax' symbiont bacterium Rs2_46_30_T18]|nr:alpha-galactosidase ['Osedax' symbiont bacterium Rs2_46_30_T18]